MQEKDLVLFRQDLRIAAFHIKHSDNETGFGASCSINAAVRILASSTRTLLEKTMKDKASLRSRHTSSTSFLSDFLNEFVDDQDNLALNVNLRSPWLIQLAEAEQSLSELYESDRPLTDLSSTNMITISAKVEPQHWLRLAPSDLTSIHQHLSDWADSMSFDNSEY